LLRYVVYLVGLHCGYSPRYTFTHLYGCGHLVTVLLATFTRLLRSAHGLRSVGYLPLRFTHHPHVAYTLHTVLRLRLRVTFRTRTLICRLLIPGCYVALRLIARSFDLIWLQRCYVTVVDVVGWYLPTLRLRLIIGFPFALLFVVDFTLPR